MVGEYITLAGSKWYATEGTGKLTGSARGNFTDVYQFILFVPPVSQKHVRKVREEER